MTKDVLVSISGLHTDVMQEAEEENEAIEVVNPANYYFRNGKHYIVYDEPVEGVSGTIKNKLKITEDQVVEIMKSGVSNAHMIFEKNKKNVSYYYTPFGSLLIGIDAKHVKVAETEENINVTVNYDLEVNYEFLANCNITVNIKSREAGDFRLS